MKKFLDRILPGILILLMVYLYLDLVASRQNLLYSLKIYLKYLILAYFIIDLWVLFTMYEENKKFFRNHWFDIILTLPFLTAFKGIKGLKIIKLSKSTKLLKPGKALKSLKFGQKIGKLVRKSHKIFRKFRG